MTYVLSARSLERLDGVDSNLIMLVQRAIRLTEIDFGVLEGLRSVERQQELVAKGASQTMRSKHLVGKAVDLYAYVGGVRWEVPLYDTIAEAIRQSAVNLDLQIRWGAAWHIPDIRKWEQPMEYARLEYIDYRRGQGRVPFVDCCHFEAMP